MENYRGVLHLLVGGVVSEAIALKKEVTVFGREKADVVLEDDEVSSHHCQIQILSGNYHLFDLNSTNGTFLNGRKILKSKIVPGDVLRMGGVEFRFGLEKDEPVIPRETIRTFEGVQKGVDGRAYGILDHIRAERARAVSASRLEIDGMWCDGSHTVVRSQAREETIGRLSTIGLFEADEELSRRHARLSVREDGRVQVEDMGSTNGTFVNEEKLTAPRTLEPGDTVRIGRTKFQVRTWVVE